MVFIDPISTFTGTDTSAMLTDDRIHPNQQGELALTSALVESLVAQRLCSIEMNGFAVTHMNTAIMDYAGVLRARWRWIAWGVLLALVATTVFLILRPPLYSSEATIFVRTPGDVSRVRDGGDSYAQARARTYAALAGSTSVAARVIADLGLDLDPETLSSRIDAANPAGTALIDISVRAPSAGEAQRTATVLLSEYAATVRALESVPGSLVPRAELVVVDPPGPAARVRLWGASIPVVLLCAALIGLVLGSRRRCLALSSTTRRANGATPRKSARWRLSGPPARTCPLTLLLSGWSRARHTTCLERTEAIGEGDRLNLKQFLAAVRRYWVTFVLVTAAVFSFRVDLDPSVTRQICVVHTADGVDRRIDDSRCIPER